MVLAEEGEFILGPLCIRRHSTQTSRYSTDVIPCRCIPTIGPTGEDLEKFVVAVDAEGSCVRILLITNPYNRLGTIYPADVMKEAIDFRLGVVS